MRQQGSLLKHFLFTLLSCFSVPVFVVVTKIDMSPANVLQETLKLLVKILKSPGCRKVGETTDLSAVLTVLTVLTLLTLLTVLTVLTRSAEGGTRENGRGGKVR